MRELKGFTFIELVMTLAIVAIMSSLALSFSEAFLQDNRISTANNSLISSINLARSVAVTRGQRASICASRDGASCTGTAWELGWIVFTDSGVAGVVDGTDQVVKISNKTGIGVSVSSNNTFIQFKPQGTIASVCVECFDQTTRQHLGLLLRTALARMSPISLAFASEDSSDSSDDSESKSSSESEESSESKSSDDRDDASGSSENLDKESTIKCIAPESQVKDEREGSSGSKQSDSDSDKSSAVLGIEQYTHYAANIIEQLSPLASAYASDDATSSESADTGEKSDSDKSSDSKSDDSEASGTSGASENSDSSDRSEENKPSRATCDDGSSTASSSKGSAPQGSSASSAATSNPATTTGSSGSAMSASVAPPFVTADSAVSESVTALAAAANPTSSGQKPLPDSTFLICDSSKAAEFGGLIFVSKIGRVMRKRVSCN